MRYAILLITASIFIFSPVFAVNNLDQDNLVSCRSSQEEPPSDSTSDRSGA
ncbi:hypothetical protein [Sphaerospermopsis torques-reginae]|jgi:hypothetical protein|uniref:Uncharacterized protein n=1 Tax=Sphaerospermopsis torques-reginae ITEP-024 TaxID=984208 RepID=A0ABX8X2M7_9CYAN|nr:hypothetical protein [Sphaerospermopsis torques-reginae]QYX32964.1 hypothetical protein K2F26_06380 [Sphaerospermopsis torques-reginae ITEP-024]